MHVPAARSALQNTNKNSSLLNLHGDAVAEQLLAKTSVNTPNHLLRHAVCLKFRLRKPMKTGIKEIFSDYVSAAGALVSAGRPNTAHLFLTTAMNRYPAKDGNGCWQEGLAQAAMDVAAALANSAVRSKSSSLKYSQYTLAISLLEKASEFSDKFAKAQMEIQMREIRISAADSFVAMAERERISADERGVSQDQFLIGYYQNKAEEFAPEDMKEKISKMYVALGAFLQAYVLREDYEKMRAARA